MTELYFEKKLKLVSFLSDFKMVPMSIQPVTLSVLLLLSALTRAQLFVDFTPEDDLNTVHIDSQRVKT